MYSPSSALPPANFLQDLLQSHIATIFTADQSRPTPARNPSPYMGERLTAFLDEMRPVVQRAATSIYYRVRPASVALDDLVQEGMIAVWEATQHYDEAKVVDPGSFPGYCMKRARGAMLTALTRSNKTPAVSLEETLEVETSDGRIVRELADRPVAQRDVNTAIRRRLLGALHQLPQLERLAILAHFRIDGGRGFSSHPDQVCKRYRLTRERYYQARRRGLLKMQRLLQG